MQDQDNARLAAWAKRESHKLNREGNGPGSPLEQEVLARWKAKRPNMVADLEKHQALEATAHVLVDRFLKARREYLKAGMPPTDAQEQAETEWLLSDPESDRPNPVLDRIIT